LSRFYLAFWFGQPTALKCGDGCKRAATREAAGEDPMEMPAETQGLAMATEALAAS